MNENKIENISRIFGMFDFRYIDYFVRDPEVLKKLFVKDFDHFEDRKGFVTEATDKIWGKGLLSLSAEKWRDMRVTLSPAFTGSKMRQMFELVSECVDEIVEFLMKTKKSIRFHECD